VKLLFAFYSGVAFPGSPMKEGFGEAIDRCLFIPIFGVSNPPILVVEFKL